MIEPPKPLPHFFDVAGWFALMRELGINPWAALACVALLYTALGLAAWSFLGSAT
jgi:hypothetical protein